MKKLIILSIASAMLISCGKNTTPPPVDYNDDDGDQILNYLETSERDKYVSNFQQITAKKANIALRLKSLSGDLKIIETTIEFNKDIRGELTKSILKNFESIMIQHDSDYFSEFASAKISPTNKKIQLQDLASTGGEVEIVFDTEEMNNDNVSVMKKTNGKYEEIFSGTISKNSLKANGLSNKIIFDNILNSDEIYFINNSNFLKKKSSYDKTLVEELKKKTYRLIVSTPKETNIYYVSTALSIQGFLDMEKIDLSQGILKGNEDYTSLYGDTQNIDDKIFLIPLNFLPASMNSKIHEGMTYALYLGKVSDIKKDYFKSLKNNSRTISRNPLQSLELKLEKEAKKELILDLDIQKNIHRFGKVQKRYSVYSSYGHQSCWIDVFESTQTYSIDANTLSAIDLELSFTIDGRSVNPTQEMNIEKNGKIFKRMIFKQAGENLIARFNAPKLNAKSGCMINRCPQSSDAPLEYEDCQLRETTDEASLTVTYQTYIE